MKLLDGERALVTGTANGIGRGHLPHYSASKAGETMLVKELAGALGIEPPHV